MLRITADEQARVLTFRLEGRLEGPWVRELTQCWRSMLEAANKPSISVDLTGVTYIDAAGKAQLADMHEHGAHFIADDCMTKAVVEEIAHERTCLEREPRRPR
jgi:anti-anti-sigma regulatory factor